MNKFLLREYFELCDGGVCQDLLTEQEKVFVKNGGMMLTGVMQRADAKNGNGRVYPENVLRREVENYKKLVAENTPPMSGFERNSLVICSTHTACS